MSHRCKLTWGCVGIIPAVRRREVYQLAPGSGPLAHAALPKLANRIVLASLGRLVPAVISIPLRRHYRRPQNRPAIQAEIGRRRAVDHISSPCLTVLHAPSPGSHPKAEPSLPVAVVRSPPLRPTASHWSRRATPPAPSLGVRAVPRPRRCVARGSNETSTTVGALVVPSDQLNAGTLLG